MTALSEMACRFVLNSQSFEILSHGVEVILIHPVSENGSSFFL